MYGLLRKAVAFLIIVGLIFVSSPELVAHPDVKSDSASLLVYKWANALANRDRSQVETILSQDFRGPRWFESRDAYLDMIGSLGTVEINLDYAVFEAKSDAIEVSPVVITIWDGSLSSAYSIVVSNRSGEWRISAITNVVIPSQLVKKLSPRNLPEQAVTVPVKFALRDSDTGQPVYARVHISDVNGEYWPPRGHMKNIPTGWRVDVGGDVHIADRTYAYVAPNFTADLVPGNYRIEAIKGTEYETIETDFVVESVPQRDTFTVNIKRWINPQDHGWYSGDTHTHFLSPHNALLEAKANDLNVINVLATKWGELITNAAEVTGVPSPVSVPGHVVHYNEESRHDWLGHTNLHPIKEMVHPLAWGSKSFGEGSAGLVDGYDYPPMAHQADKAHAQGALVSWAHFPRPAGELAVDVALGKIDTVDLFTWGDAFVSTRASARGGMEPGPVLYWYKFLNTGFRLPVTAGTDKMHNTQVAGSVRTYAYLAEKQFTYEGWIEALRQGRTMVTTGPMIFLKVNGQDTGSVLNLSLGDKIEVEAAIFFSKEADAWQKLEIVQDGQVIASLQNKNKKSPVTLRTTLKVTQSTWIAARVYGAALPYQAEIPRMAHTSPIYVMLPGSEIWSESDAAFLAEQCEAAIHWAKEDARFHTEQQRAEVIALYKRAQSIYQRRSSSTE